MLSKCANPECSASFQYLRQGKLFEIRSDSSHFHISTPDPASRKGSHRVEHFWLCENCASRMTIAVNRNRDVLVMPLTFKTRGAAA